MLSALARRKIITPICLHPSSSANPSHRTRTRSLTGTQPRRLSDHGLISPARIVRRRPNSGGTSVATLSFNTPSSATPQTQSSTTTPQPPQPPHANEKKTQPPPATSEEQPCETITQQPPSYREIFPLSVADPQEDEADPEPPIDPLAAAILHNVKASPCSSCTGTGTAGAAARPRSRPARLVGSRGSGGSCTAPSARSITLLACSRPRSGWKCRTFGSA